MSNTVLDLSKKFELNLQKQGFTTIPTMQTRLAVDKSGSMYGLFKDGFVEKTIELFMGAASKFDDNATLEYTFFNSSTDKMKSIGVDDYKKMSIPDANGGTNYTPPLSELATLETASVSGVFGKLFGKKEEAKSDPTYIGFITDGEPSDLNEAIDFMDELDGTRNFVQFIVLGTGVSTSTMQSLTKNANSAYAVIPNPSNMTVDELYDIIANQTLLNWYKAL